MIILPSRNGMLLRNSNGIISSDCGGFSCPCELLTGTKCSCFNINQTPSAYVVEIEGKGKFCLKYVSGCTWSVTIETTVVTLNLTYNTNMARLHVYHNRVLVFNAYTPVTSCLNRLQGYLKNTQVSDWGDALYYPACLEPRNCNLLRLVKVEIDFGRDFIYASGSYSPYVYSTREVTQQHIVFGYLNNVCQLSGVESNTAVVHRSGWDCAPGQTELYAPGTSLYYSHINGDADYVTIQYSIGIAPFFYTQNYRIETDLAIVPSGTEFIVPNARLIPTGNTLFPSCAEYDYNEASGSYNPQPVGGTATITVY